VAAKQDLVELMVDRGYSPVPSLPHRSEEEPAWRPALEHWAQQASERYLTHPWPRWPGDPDRAVTGRSAGAQAVTVVKGRP
jgi:hypothetical protein